MRGQLGQTHCLMCTCIQISLISPFLSNISLCIVDLQFSSCRFLCFLFSLGTLCDWCNPPSAGSSRCGLIERPECQPLSKTHHLMCTCIQTSLTTPFIFNISLCIVVYIFQVSGFRALRSPGTLMLLLKPAPRLMVAGVG